MSTWTSVASQLNSQNIASLVTYNNKVYGGTYTGGRLFEWNDSVRAAVFA